MNTLLPDLSCSERGAGDWKARVPLAGVSSFTLQDFPDRSACILWFAGCQMRCPYCHNPDLVEGKRERIDVEYVLRFLRMRKGYLDGVVFSGGECLLSRDIVPLITEIRKLGFAVKVDTNGAVPDRLETLLAGDLVDYVAMDFKAPLNQYERLTSWTNMDAWIRSFRLLQVSPNVDYELRSTLHPDLVSEEMVNEMLDELEALDFKGVLYLQHFREAPRMLGLSGPASRRYDFKRLVLEGRPFEVRLRNFTRHERLLCHSS